MKLRLPHKFQAALMAALASVSFTTLSTGTIAVATGAVLLAGQQAQADEPVKTELELTVPSGQQIVSGNSGLNWTTSGTTGALSSWEIAFTLTTSTNKEFFNLNASNTAAQGYHLSLEDGDTITLKDNSGQLVTSVGGFTSGAAITLSFRKDVNDSGTALGTGTFYLTVAGTGAEAAVSNIATSGANDTTFHTGSSNNGPTRFWTTSGNLKFTNIQLYQLNDNTIISSDFTWNGTQGDHDWSHAVWNGTSNFAENGNAMFGADGYEVVTLSGTQKAGDITISDKAYTFEGSGTLTVTGAVTVNSSLVLNSAATAQAMLPKVAGAGNVTLNAVAELGSGVATTGTGELTINSTRGSGAYDLKLQGGNGATHDFSHFSKVNLAEGVVIEYDAGQTTLNNVTLQGDASFNMYDMGTGGNGIWLKGATALGSHTLAFNNRSGQSWKRKVTIDQLTGDATSKLQFLGGASGDGVGSKLYVNSLQGFSGTLRLDEKNTGNAVEATVKTGTGSAVEIAGVEFAGTGELLELTAQTAINLGTVSVANDSDIKFHDTTSQTSATLGTITIEKLAGNATGKTLKLYSADQTNNGDAHHIVLGAADADYTSNLYNGTLWVTSNSNQGQSARSTVDAYLVAQDVLKNTTLKLQNWDSNYNNTRISLSLGTDAKVAGINSANTGKYSGWGAYIRSGQLTVAQPNVVADFASTSETAYTLEITGAGTYTSNAYIMGQVNLTMSGTGTQTFSGDVSSFNGTITVNNGTLKITGSNGITAAYIDSETGNGTLEVTNTLTLTGAPSGMMTSFTGTLKVGGLHVDGGYHQLNGIARLGETIQVNENGTLIIGSGTYVLTDLEMQKSKVVVPTTENGYATWDGTVQFITGGGTVMPQENVIFQHGDTTSQVWDANTGVVTFAGAKDYTYYYVNESASYDAAAMGQTTTGYIVAGGATFTAAGTNLAGKELVLGQGSTWKTSSGGNFNAQQVQTLTLQGDATVTANANASIAGTSATGATSMSLGGHTLQVGGNGSHFALFNTTATDAGTIQVNNNGYLQVGHSGKQSSADLHDVVVNIANGGHLTVDNNSTISVEGFTGSGTIQKDGGSGGTITIEADHGDYTFNGSISSTPNLTMSGYSTGTQTFNLAGNTTFGQLNALGGTLKFTGAGNITASSIAGTFGTLDIASTLTLNNSADAMFDGGLALGGLNKQGAGNLTIAGLTRLGSTIQVTEGSLVLAGGTYDISGIAAEGGSTLTPPATSGYAALTATVHFVNGSFSRLTEDEALVFMYKGNTSNTLKDDGTVDFSGTDYSTYYLVGEGDTLNLTTEQTTNPLLQNVNLTASAGTITVTDERSLTGSLTQAGGSTLTVAGGGSLTVGSISNNAAVSIAANTSLTSTQAEMIVGGGNTFTTSGEGTLHLQTLRVHGNGAKVTLGADTELHMITTGAGTLDINADATMDALQIGFYNAASTVNIGADATVHITGTTVSDSGGEGNASFMVSNHPQANTLNIAGHLISDAGISSRDGSANLNVQSGGTLELRAGLNRNTGRSHDINVNVADGATLVAAGYATDRSAQGLHVNLADGATLQGYYGTGNAITIAQALTLSGSSNTAKIEAADGKTLTISGAIGGAGGFTKTGTGTLVLSGNNSYTGGTVVSAGTLKAASANALGAGTLTLNTGSTLAVETGTTANVLDVTVAGNATISNGGTLVFTGKGGINVAAGVSVTLSGNGTYDLSGMDMEEGTGTVVYTGGAEGTTLNGFAKAAGTIDFIDITAEGSAISYGGGASFTYKGANGTFDSATGKVEVQAQDYDYTIFYVNEKEDYVSNALVDHGVTLDHIALGSGTTLNVNANIDISKIQPRAGATGYTIDVNSGSTLNITKDTDTSAVTGEGIVHVAIAAETQNYRPTFNADAPFTGTLVFDEATSIGNHNSYVVLDDTFKGTLELRGRMNGHAMNLGGATTLRLVGDRNSNFTGIWDAGTAMHITQALEVTGNSRVDLWSENNQTTILDGTVNGGTDKVGHLSKENNGNMNFNGAVALAEFITPGGTINFNAGANISTVNANGGNVNFKGDSTIDTLTANATATVDQEATLALGTVNGTAANLVINGTVNVNGGTENALNNVTINQGGSLTFGAGTTTIEGALSTSEVITSLGNITLNGSVNIDGLDDAELTDYTRGGKGGNGFKQYGGSLTVVDTDGVGSVTVKDGTVITYKDAAGTLGSDGKFTLTDTTVKYDAYYVNTDQTSESLAHALTEAAGHGTLTTVQLSNGTGLDLDSADATLQHLVLTDGASASLNVTQSASITSVEGLGAGQTLSITGTAGKVLTMSASGTVAGAIAVQDTTLQLGANLTLNGGMDNAGTISMAGKTLTLNGTTAYNLGNVTGNDQSYITVGNNATAVVDGNVTVRRVYGNVGSNIEVKDGSTLTLLTTGRSNYSEIHGDLDIKGTVSFKSDGGDMRFYGTSDDQVFNLGHLVVDGGTGRVDLLTAGDGNYSSTIAAKSLSGGGSSHILEVTTCYTGGTAGTGKVVKFVIGDENSTATAASYTGTIKYGVGSGSVKAGGGMNLVIKDEYVAANAVLETIMDGGTYGTVTVDTERAKVKGLKDTTSGKTVNVSGTAADKNRVLEIVGNDNYTYNGKLGANLDVVHSGSGTQSFGGVDGFDGSIDVEGGVLNILNIAQATNLSVRDVTIKNGTLGVYNSGTATADTDHEGTLTIKNGQKLTAAGTATLNAGLVMETGSTLDVTGTNGAGLAMGSPMTLNTGMTLKDYSSDWATWKDGTTYVLYTGVDSLNIGSGAQTAAIDYTQWVDAQQYFTNIQEANRYFLCYTGAESANGGVAQYTFDGSNVGTVYIMVMPEPTTGTLSLLALAALAARRRKHN